MKSIKDIMQNSTRMRAVNEELKQFRQQILSNPRVRYFLNEHSDEINDEIIDRGLADLNEFVEQNRSCDHCSSVDECTNLVKGFRPHLELSAGTIRVKYLLCEKGIVAEKQRKIREQIHTIHIPAQIKNAQFSDLVSKGRVSAVRKALEFGERFPAEKFGKGLYFHGGYGVGKTFLLGAIANHLAEIGISSYIVYWPDFLREIKGSFEDHSYNRKIDSIREVPVLMIDDIGAESLTAWSRDEVLGTILQYRMQEQLPTCFTSNFNFTELEEHLSFSSSGQETAKAKRIMERIQFLAEAVEVGGPNRRQS